MEFTSVGEMVKTHSGGSTEPQRKAGGGGQFHSVAETVALKTAPGMIGNRSAGGGQFDSPAEMVNLNRTPQPVRGEK